MSVVAFERKQDNGDWSEKELSTLVAALGAFLVFARALGVGSLGSGAFVALFGGVIGVAGAFVATFIGQMIGWYRLDQGAGLIGATVGALIVLFIWHQVVSRRSA